MTRLEANLQILGLMAKVAAEYPELRFIQVVQHAFNTDVLYPLFYTESEELLKKVRVNHAASNLPEKQPAIPTPESTLPSSGV